MQKNRNILIGVLLFVILVMAVAYSAFATQTTLEGNAKIINEWNVKITDVSAQYVSPGCNAGDIQFTDTSVTFNAELANPGDYITYMIMIENQGNMDAVLENVTFIPEETGSSAIIYTIRNPIDSLTAGNTACALVQVMYDPNTTEMPSKTTRSVTGTIEYKEDIRE